MIAILCRQEIYPNNGSLRRDAEGIQIFPVLVQRAGRDDIKTGVKVNLALGYLKIASFMKPDSEIYSRALKRFKR